MLCVTLNNVQLTSSFRQNDIGSLKLKGKQSQIRETCDQGEGGRGRGLSNSTNPGSQISLLVTPLCSFFLGKY